MFLFFLLYDEWGRVGIFTSAVMVVRAALERGALGEDCRLVNQRSHVCTGSKRRRGIWGISLQKEMRRLPLWLDVATCYESGFS